MQQDRFFQTKFNSMKNIDQIMQESPKPRALFLTQRQLESHISEIQHQAQLVDIQHQKNLEKIQSQNNQLNQFINQLDQRVHEVMEHNESEIITAYKNHIAMVKKDMQQLRNKSMAQVSNSSSHLQRIQQLQKQVAIFREESLILFRKLAEKEKQLQDMRAKRDQFANQTKFMEQSMKSLAKRNKQLQVELAEKKITSIQQQQDDFTQKFDLSHLHGNMLQNKNYRHKQRTTLTSAHNISKTITQNTQINLLKSNHFALERETSSQQIFHRKLRMKLEYLQSSLLNDILKAAQQVYIQTQKFNSNRTSRLGKHIKQKQQNLRATKISMRSKSNCTVDYESLRPQTAFSVSKPRQSQRKQFQTFKLRQQMADYFVKCVQTLKKQIIKRKKLNTLNFYKQGNPISLSEFKKIDWFRLMELLLTNQKVISALYNILIHNSK